MNRPFSRRICLCLALTALLLGLSASFGIDTNTEEKLADEKVVESTHSSNQSLTGFQAGSIYTETVLVSSLEYTCVNMKIPSWVNARTKCWGANNYGYLGNGNWSQAHEPYFVQYDSGSGMTKSLGSFGFHTVSVQTNGVTNSWGTNEYGELGLGNTNTNTVRGNIGYMPPNRTALHVEAGADTSCMIADDQSVWCWGRNDPFGQTGTNTTTSLNPVISPTKVLIPNNQSAIALSMGWNFACVILEDRTGMCWGKNANGQLGNGNYDYGQFSHPTPAPITIIPPNRTLSAISLGGGHACSILDNGSVFCWGGGRNGQLGDGTHSNTSTTGNYVPLPAGRTAISISSGVRHTCTILDDHSTWCWGNNTEGQIGDGTSVPNTGEANWEHNHPSSPVAVSVPAGIEFAAISAGQDHTCAVATNGSLWCWGGHGRGQLGLGRAVDSMGYWNIVDSDIPAWVNLSGQSSASAYIPLSDRDLDNDGNLSIFDRTPLGTPVCPPGQYLIVADETCNDASPGHYVPNSNMTYETPCSLGTYQPNAGQSSCDQADPGFYVPNLGSLDQTPCDVGTYQNASGQSSCHITPIGHYNDVMGSISPIPCSPGYFQSSEGQANCIASQAGYHVPIEGQSTQTICEAGTFQPGTGMSLCWRANLGNYVGQEGATQQTDCQPGTYADVRGLVECKEADPGYFVATNLSATQSACLPGEYQPLSGQDSCLMTDTGHYNPDPGSSDMIPCEQGYFEDQMGSTSCNPSEPGYHVPSTGSSSQTECPVGTYSTENAIVTCTDASLGYYVPEMGSSAQLECLAGTYTSEEGASSCTDADPGHIVRFDGSSQQEECMPGSYQPDSGSTDCIAASPGNFVSYNAATGQTECLPGTYQWDTGQTDCLDSPAGQYSAESGSSTVENCDPGTYQPDTGQSSCLEADEGHFVDGFGATEQVPCEVGSFQSITGQSSCQQSDPGHIVSSVGSSEQTPCLPGTYQPLFGKESCILASADYFVESSGSSQQTLCPSGESQPEEGQSSCITDDDGGLPIVAIAGAAIVVLAIGGFLMTQGKSKSAPKGKKVRRPPEGAKRRRKRPEGARRPKAKEGTSKKIEED